jgi:DNA end-binding protein Ku
MAKQLIGNLAGEWDPAKYTDENRANLMRVIQAKVKGKEPHLTEEVEPKQAEVIDLMERLRQSLGAAPAATRVVKAGTKKAGAAGRAGKKSRTPAKKTASRSRAKKTKHAA